MKELLEQYRHVTHQAKILSQVTEHSMITLHTELSDALDVINHKADRLAHDIAFALQQQPDDSTKQSDKGPEPINNVLHKPLWARVPKGNVDDCWRQNKGHLGQVAYHLFTSREDAEMRIAEGYKAVPVWGE
jgi:hypothetical protein